MGLAAGTVLGRYVIGALIGAGGMGEVYRAHDPKLGRDVAVKVLPGRLAEDSDRRRRFEREARAAAELEHPNILAVYDVGVDDGVPFIVTELLDGGTLADALRRGPLPRARAVEIGVQIARGVAAAHEKGIVHRDLKPANVFLCRDGRVKILDFGLAAHVAEETSKGEDTTLTETGAILGTPAYMSPEQVRGQRADPRTDLFALGTILYEMLSGRRPFAADSPVELAHAILTEEPEPLDDPALDPIVRRCLAKDPAARLGCAVDLAFMLETVAAPGPAAPRPSARRAWAVAIASGVVALLALGWAMRPTHEVASAPTYTRITFAGQPDRARFAPDGHTIIYSSAMSRGEYRVFASTPGRPEARPLTEPGTQLVSISPTGEMLLQVRTPDGKDVIARAPLAGGVPRVVYDDVIDADFSSDGSELAIVRRVDGQRRLEYPVGHVLFETLFEIGPVRVSPGGDRVAFILWDSPAATRSAAFNPSGTLEVVGRDGARSTLWRPWTQLTGLAWAPDGREVWVTGRRDAFHPIFAVDLEGHERKVLELPAWVGLHDIARDGRVLIDISDQRWGIAALLPGRSAETDLSWYDQTNLRDLSADGRLILFTEAGESSQEREEAYLRRTDGSPAVHLGTGRALALSPDGAWTLARPPDDSLSQLLLVPTGAGERRPLHAGPIAQYAQAYFFVDGRRIALRARAADHLLRVWVQDLAGGDPRPVSDEGIAWLARPSAQGDVVAACRIDGSCALYPVAGGAPRPLPPLQRLGRPLQFTPDGKSLVVGRPVSLVDAPEERAALWLVDVAGGNERVLRELQIPEKTTFNWMIFRLTADASGYAYMYQHNQADLVLIEGLR